MAVTHVIHHTILNTLHSVCFSIVIQKELRAVGPRKNCEHLPLPTIEDFAGYTGGHTHRKWRQVGHEWRCPSCKRTKFEQLTWTQQRRDNGRVPTGRFIWLAPIVEHHDHGAIRGLRHPRFAPTLLCFDCNIAEGRVKRVLRLPSDFSFSPEELNAFITGYPHRRVTENLDIAAQIAERVIRLANAG